MEDAYDVVIVGAGMAGMSAAIYAAADGMKVLLIEEKRPGGQAWHSPKIDNVAGMPGISGILLADRTIKQATEMGADYIEDRVVDIEIEGEVYPYTFKVSTQGGYTYEALSVVLATGKRFNPLGLKGAEPLLGKQVFYGEAAIRGPRLFKKKDVAVVGGGNASAQSVIDLSLFCAKVHVIIRHKATWSNYLNEKIQTRPNVRWYEGAEVVEIVTEGGEMKGISVVQDNGRFDLGAQGLFILAGQSTDTTLPDKLKMRTWRGGISTECREWEWPDRFKDVWRDGYPMETNVPGIFAIGDCRDGMGHGIAVAMGDGNSVVGSIWQHLSYFPARHQALLPTLPPALLRPLPVSLSSDETPTG